MASCGNDDAVEIPFTGNETAFALLEVGNSGVEGTVRFKEREDGAILVVIQTDGSPTTAVHPAHVHANTTAEGGGILISLNPVTNGLSETLVTEMDDGTAISYIELIDLDGHVNVHESADDLTIVAQGDLGDNVLTGEAEFYQLFTPGDNPESVATVAIKERENGSALIEVEYTGAAAGGNPVKIFSGTLAENGDDVLISLSDINNSGMSVTNISEMDNGTAITYSELIDLNGYMVIETNDSNTTPLAEGDIGGNEFTGDDMTYTLSEANSSGMAGEATFYKRNNGTTLVVLEMAGTLAGSSHPAHIHYSSVAEGGSIAAPLNNVVEGLSLTEVSQLQDGTAITYDELLTFDGHINVHLSASDLSVYVAQGNIGSNN